MPISKLTGPMLSNILVRDGEGIAFSNTANSTPLLYIDIANSRIGVNTDTPTTDFTINGAGFASSLNLTNSISLGGNVVALGDVISVNMNATGNVNTVNLSASGFANAVNISASGNINAFANVTSGNVNTVNLAASGFANAVNISASGNINAFANITSGNVNTENLTTSNNLSISGNANINSLNVTNISVSGSITGNVTTSTTGNIDAGNLVIANTATLGNIVIVDTTISSVGNVVTFAGTAGIAVPVGNLLQRPANVPAGTLRFNTTNDSLETWDGADWINTSAQPSTIFDQQIVGTNATTYALTQSVADENNVIVSINGLTQLPGTAYTIVGTDIIFAQPLLTTETADLRYLTYPVGVPAYGNANVAAYLTTYAGNISATNMLVSNTVTATTFIGNFQGNITGNLVVPGSNTWVLYNNAGNAGADIGFRYDAATKDLVVGNTITANFFVGNASQLTGLPVTYGNANVEAYLPTSSTIANVNSNVANLSTSITATNANVANVNSNVATISNAVVSLSGITYANSNVAAYLPTYTGNITSGNVSTTGNVTASYFVGNGSQLTNLVSVSGTASTVTTNSQPNITSVGTLSTLSVTGSIIAGNLLVSSQGRIGVAPQQEIHVAGNGSDADGNGSITNPYRTITHALTQTSTGHVIVVHPGIYTEDVVINNVDNVAITAAAPGSSTPQSYVINGNVTVSGTSSSILLLSIGVVGSITHSSSGSFFVTAIQLGTGGSSTTFAKTGTGYLEVTNGNWTGGTPAVSVTGAGPVTFNGVQLTNLTVNNANASVILRNVPSAINTTLTSGTLTVISSTMVGNSNTAPAITTVAGTLNIQNSLLLRANNTAGIMTVGAATAYLYDDIFFDRTNSTLAGIPISGTAFAPPAEFQAVRADSMSVSGNNIALGNVVGGNIRTVGSITATGNITGNFFVGNGSLLTGIAVPSSTKDYVISASGSADYVFSGPGIFAGNTNDPVLYLYRGDTYTFNNTTGASHPFAIRVSAGGAAYTSPGLTGSQTGVQTFQVPMNAPSTLYYQCTIHGNMGNVINII